MDDEDDLLDVGLDTSPSFDVSNGMKTKMSTSPQHTNATAANQMPNRIETASWLQGRSNEISQRDLILREMEAKRGQDERGNGASPTVVIHGDSFRSDEDEGGESLSLRDRVRKTAVAVTGSAIVASGTVMLVTPAHPFGHAVQAAGLGVLATEFEGPKKTFEKTKARASYIAKKITGSSSSSLENDNNNKSEPLPLGPSPLQDTSELQRSFASSSYVSPFRKTSIPPNNAKADPKQNPKADKPTVKESVPKPTLNRQGSTSLSSLEGIPPFNKKEAKAKAKAKNVPKPIPKPTLNRQGSTSLSGGI